MFRTASFILRLVLALVLLAGVMGAVAFAFRAGYSQGYVVGAATEGEGLPAAPGYWARPGMMPGYGMHFFPPMGLFFCFGPLLFIVLLAAVFRPRHWHHHGWKDHPHGPWMHNHPDWAHEHPHSPEHAPENKDEPKAPDAG